MARVVLVTMGSWGDLFPFVGLAAELRARGHDVLLAASPAWEEIAAEAGVPFAGVGRRIGFEEFRAHPEIFGPMPFGLRHALDRFLFDQIDELTADLRAAFAGADLVVAHPAQVVALDVAEHGGVPAVVATVFPAMIPSAHTVPGGVRLGPWTGPAGRVLNRAVWRAVGLPVAALFDPPVNRHRRSLGLPPVRGALFALPRRARGVVVMAPAAVVQAPPDWPPSVAVTSFVAWDGGHQRPLDPATEEFLAGGPAPVLVTLGSSTAVQPEDVFELATGAVLDQGHRALVVTGPAPAPPGLADAEGVHLVDYAPFSSVAPRCRAAVHHAGLGTTVAVIRAGIPQLVVPKGFDQPDTAALLTRLGVGLSVPWNRRHRRLPAAVSRVVTDGEMARRAVALRDAVGPGDGAEAAAEVIEGHLSPPPG